MAIAHVERIVTAGKSETVEFEKSTAQLARGDDALCPFLDGQEVRR